MRSKTSTGAFAGVVRAGRYAEVDLGSVQARVRRVTSRDLLAHGYPLLLAARVAAASEGEAQSAASGKAMGRIAEYREALACSGVAELRALAEDGWTEWEPWTLVADAAAEDLDAHRIWLGSLPVDLGRPEDLLSEAVLAHSGEGKAAEAMASFRGSRPVPPGQAGEAVRAPADRDPGPIAD
jgi:hypothetical protein